MVTDLKTVQVHVAFGKLFQMKVILFLQEIFSVLVTPFVLWYTLPKCAGPVVDFFREFTIHVDGLGYVCSFAVSITSYDLCEQILGLLERSRLTPCNALGL